MGFPPPPTLSAFPENVLDLLHPILSHRFSKLLTGFLGGHGGGFFHDRLRSTETALSMAMRLSQMMPVPLCL